MDIRQRLKEKNVILLDGAMGTELQRRGIPTVLPLWSAQAIIDFPQVIKDIHKKYLSAGAEIITTNTFRTNIRTVSRSRIGRSAEELTAAAVSLAQEAVNESGRKVAIAGSIAPVEDCYSPDLVPGSRELIDEHRILAQDLKKYGVNLILIETMNTIVETVAAARAASETGLPFFVSFVVGKDTNLLSGESLLSAVRALDGLDVRAILLNCIPASTSLRPLGILKSVTSLPIGIYANGNGIPDDGQGWRFSGEEKLEEYLNYAGEWVKLGVKIIGGCCGTTPQYISRLRKLINGDR